MRDTRTVTGRAVHLPTVEALEAEVGRVASAAARGEVRALGNWTPAQIFQHLGKLIAFSFDGFPFTYPRRYRWASRLLARISWRWLVSLAFRPGFRNPPEARALEPDADVRLGDAAAYLRGQLARIREGERMAQPSPAEGLISHEQWVYAHLRHAELHLSFLVLESDKEV